MNIVFCEDNHEDRLALNFLIKRFFRELICPVKITVYEKGGLFLSDWDNGKLKDTKIVFLDIFMPEVNGIEVARKIRETDEDMVIIFTTSSKDHGLDGYSVQAFQYLVKPVAYPELAKTLDKCVKLFSELMRFIEVTEDRLKVKVFLKDILYMEIFNTTSLIHTGTRTIKSYIPLHELEKQLDGCNFLRTHRSFIVNMRHIDDVAKDAFVLKNGKTVPIRRNDKLAVKQAYMDYLSAMTRGL